MSQLSAAEIDLFRKLKKVAILLLLFIRLDRPLGETEIASILKLHPLTVRRYLRSLSATCVIARSGRYSGYILTAGGRQLVLPMAPAMLADSAASVKKSRSTVKKSRSRLTTTTEVNNNNFNKTAEVVEGKVKKSRSTVKKSRSSGCSSDLENALYDVGIQRNHRTEGLFSSEHLTPSHVYGHAGELKFYKPDRFSTGLLITTLEAVRPGDLFPETNRNGHYVKCKCKDCQHLYWAKLAEELNS